MQEKGCCVHERQEKFSVVHFCPIKQLSEEEKHEDIALEGARMTPRLSAQPPVKLA